MNKSSLMIFWLLIILVLFVTNPAFAVLLETFNNPTPEANDWFGVSVSISGNNVLVGAPRDDTGATNAGSAYLFDATTGELLQTFNNPTPATDDRFGGSVSISGNNVLVGTPGDNTGDKDAGSAYLFDATTGELLQTFNNPTPAREDFFGTSVSISGKEVLVGATGDNTGATNAGSAYLFGKNGCLIATAAFGSELAKEVQILREIRDNVLLKTNSGSFFMINFNTIYYSFSPTIADLERQNPMFKEIVKLTITPLITSLSILNHVDIDSESEVVGYGISIILLNLGIYFIAPTIVLVKIKKKLKK